MSNGEGEQIGDDDEWTTDEDIEDDCNATEHIDEMEVEDDDSGNAAEENSADNKRKVYLPGKPLKKYEELVHDPTAYIMYHEAQTGLFSSVF